MVVPTALPPDTFRLRYRAEISEAVRAIIQHVQPATEDAIRSATPTTIADVDSERFVAPVLEEFKAMHAGNTIRFGLRPLAFEAWRKRNLP